MAILLVILLYSSPLVVIHALNTSTPPTVQLPIVDLGYGLHQASFNSSGDYYNFSNIRYAEPPLGKLRFAAPVLPIGQNRTIDDGSVARICPQAYPAGAYINQIFNTYYSLTGKTDLGDFQNATQSFDYPRNTPQDPRATEDCLFLDVMVPRTVFDNYHLNAKKSGTGAAVMVWIHGGGYCAGTKYDTPPAGLISRSQSSGREGVIYVAMNYRLGAFGWLSGSTFAVDGTPNAGLYDQRLALEWIRDNIHLFGGDPDRVTVFGQSAGGGSIVLQMTAYGGEKGGAPFQRAILESPGYTPMSGNHEKEKNFQTFLNLLNVSTLNEARQVHSDAIQAANEYQVRNSRQGSWTYGPEVDGVFIPELPSLLLLHDRYDHSVDVMLGHTGDEGVGYPSIQNETAFEGFIASFFSNAPTQVHEHITQVLYPSDILSTIDKLEDYDPRNSKSIVVSGYNSTHGRHVLLISESVIDCLTYYVSKAFKGNTYKYLFATPPALHAQELYYVFYNEQYTDVFLRPINVTLAHIVQDYWINFAKFGNPNGKGLPYFPRWGTNSSAQSLSLAGVGPTQDPADNDRCRWWQLGLYV